jgi:hypothetical protein
MEVNKMMFEDKYGNVISGDEDDDPSWEDEDGGLPGFGEVNKMMFEDKYGNLMTADEVDELSSWEVEDRDLHVFEWRL